MKYLFSLFIFVSISIFAQDSAYYATSQSNCKQVVLGTVRNFLTDEIVPNVTVQLLSNGELISAIETGNDGKFSFNLECNKRYNINGRAENFTINSKIIYTSSKGESKELDLKLYPTREFVERNANKYIDTNTIDFETDVDYISESAQVELEKVVNILRKYPKMHVSIEVHTDSKGESDYALNITKQRADIIANFLIEKGIEADRLETHGLGDTQLTNHCAKGIKCTEAQHRANRRIEFLVIPYQS
jgi:outer membrane protein OmpA-like peptidoglycan-associated protein